MKRREPPPLPNWMERALFFVVEHPVAALVMWLLGYLVLFGPLAASAPLKEPTRFGLLAWVCIATLADVPFAVVLIRSRLAAQQPLHALSGLLALAQAVALIPIVALFDRAPQWLTAIGFAEALFIMVIGVRHVRRIRAINTTPNEPGI